MMLLLSLSCFVPTLQQGDAVSEAGHWVGHAFGAGSSARLLTVSL